MGTKLTKGGELPRDALTVGQGEEALHSQASGLLRGHEKVSREWTLVCLAYNVKRLWTLQAAARTQLYPTWPARKSQVRRGGLNLEA